MRVQPQKYHVWYVESCYQISEVAKQLSSWCYTLTCVCLLCVHQRINGLGNIHGLQVRTLVAVNNGRQDLHVWYN